jgi:hypothetical protein
VPAVQCPAVQVSAPLQTSPSPHAVPSLTGAWTQPAVGSQESVVQGFPSSQVSAVPAWHAPSAVQVSWPSHRVALSQARPGAGVWTQPLVGSQASSVQGLASSQSRA